MYLEGTPEEDWFTQLKRREIFEKLLESKILF